ncbi:phosphopantothenate--cysteine ligase [Copidosoma floridanum]|uniref:phosphopantothenate--cysteine ligase n=1 Tax=Copidosoma floridanum TaxID=29053 RepID=UPI0006C9C292|nr:phosphopantothenate--cysteine ligase [Copidosoma floridanum]
MSSWEEFYAKSSKPSDLDKNENLLKKFVEHHIQQKNYIVLVTSGGTTVPLEHNTVRFVDNFSAGNRGAISAEYFLDHGYAVIFMHRTKSLEPFSRHFSGRKILDMLNLSIEKDVPSISVAPQYVNETAVILKKYKEALDKNKLLQISFTTLSEYLWLLQSTCKTLAPVGNRAVLYLAAAVSDFYIPASEMAVHKIPSDDPLAINLKLVPKMLKPLVNSWVPKAFVVSFKLETDDDILVSKALAALNKYNHNLVIANNLQTRRRRVIVVSKKCFETLTLSEKQRKNGEEIEKLIVSDLVEKHQEWISSAD